MSTVLVLWLPALTWDLRGQGKMARVFWAMEGKVVDLDTVRQWLGHV